MAAEGSFQGYWRVYGRFPSLMRSTYFWVAVLITVIGYPYWSKVEANKEPKWTGLTLDIGPSLLGFAVGGMAIMLSFSSGRFLDAIRQKGKYDSYFMKVMASFFHFTTITCSSIIIAVISQIFPNIILSSLGFFVTVYSVLLAVATVDHLWQTAAIFNKAIDKTPGAVPQSGADDHPHP